MKSPQCVWITGASGAIGTALAKAYAAPGVQLVLHGRQAPLLASLAAECRAVGAAVEVCLQDVREVDAWRACAQALAAHYPPDLVVANAGMNAHPAAGQVLESWQDSNAIFEINLRANMALVHAVLPAMQARGRGQIALVSSLAAWFGLPVTPAYCASKAGLKVYGEGLRGALAAHGIAVNVIMPGYVASAMCHAMPGPKPFLRTPAQAANIIRWGLRWNLPRISFPFPLNLGTWALAVIHPWISQRIVKWLGYVD